MTPAVLDPARRRGAAAPFHALMVAFVLAAVSVAGCGGDDGGGAGNGAGDQATQGTTDDPPLDERTLALLAPIAIPPATVIPPGVNEVALPEDAEAVQFSFTHVELTADGRDPRMMAMLVADTFARRTRGLMFRDSLPPNTGMIFAFPAVTNGPFWNKDTGLDLDIAFLSESGTIQEILTLIAFDTELVTPELDYAFAVELPSGWFQTNGYGPGDRFVIPEGVVGLAE